MIKINLASLKQSGVGAEPKAIKLSTSSITSMVDLDKVKELHLERVIVPLVLGFGASLWLDNYKEEEVTKLASLLGRINAENTKLQSDLAKFKAYDAVKQSLDQDEMTIKSKLETIQKLISDRAVPLKILTTLSSTIPGNVWLTEVKLQSSQVNLKGLSLGFTEISDFMKGLREVVYFSSVDLLDTEQAKDRTGGEVANFELNIKRR